jgi:3-phenylpropionate/trans-cinnamate dioxygenase ferredoxin reductase subunit
MECSGLPELGSYDRVAYRGDPKTLEFIAFWLSGDAIIAGMNVNVWDVTDDIQALIRSHGKVDVGRLTDLDIPLSDI